MNWWLPVFVTQGVALQVLTIGAACIITVAVTRRTMRRWPLTTLAVYIALSLVGTVANFLGHDWGWFAAQALLTIFYVALFISYWRKRKRKHRLAALGAKSKALRDALVRKLREHARPRRVLRPSPVPS